MGGGDLNLVSTYVGELAPASKRGRISNLTFLVGILGQAVTPFVALALVPTLSHGWRLLFVIGGLIATIGLIARFNLPESPRWLALHGHVEEADELVTRMEKQSGTGAPGCRSRSRRMFRWRATPSRSVADETSLCRPIADSRSDVVLLVHRQLWLPR